MQMTSDAMAEALRLAHAALAASSDDWEAATIAATVISSMGGSIETALSASQRALALNPNGYLAHMHNGWIQCIAGNPAAAIDPFTRALRLSPRDRFGDFARPDSVWPIEILVNRRKRLVWAQRAIVSLPLLASGYRTAAVALVDLGRVDEARKRVAQLLKRTPPKPCLSRVCPPAQSQQGHGRSLDCSAAHRRAAGLRWHSPFR